MTKEEALKLALEALEEAWYHVGTFQPTEKAIDLYDEARTAIKEALAQPEHGWTPERIAGIARLKDAQDKRLAQPEQEPVAWRNAAIRLGEDLCSVGPFGYYDMTAEQWLDWALSVVTVHAPPPQRTWVGLTEDEAFACQGRDYFETYRAIEAKLKEKNT